jgi:hypothetical protein
MTRRKGKKRSNPIPSYSEDIVLQVGMDKGQLLLKEDESATALCSDDFASCVAIIIVGDNGVFLSHCSDNTTIVDIVEKNIHSVGNIKNSCVTFGLNFKGFEQDFEMFHTKYRPNLSREQALIEYGMDPAKMTMKLVGGIKKAIQTLNNIGIVTKTEILDLTTAAVIVRKDGEIEIPQNPGVEIEQKIENPTQETPLPERRRVSHT